MLELTETSFSDVICTQQYGAIQKEELNATEF